jgi:hypothetical protein
MIDIFDLWEEFIGSVNTHQGGSVKPHRNFTKWLHTISLGLYEEKFQAWGKGQKILDDLSAPFCKSVNLQIKAVSGAGYGIANFPDDYGHFDAVRFYLYKGKPAPLPDLPIYNCLGSVEKPDTRPSYIDEEVWEYMQAEKKATQAREGKPISENAPLEAPIDKINSDRWGAMLTHRRNKPTLERPKVNQHGKGLRVAPAQVNILVLDYLKKPAAPVFKYKTVAGDPRTGEGDIMVYDRQASTQLEWSELVRGEFINRLETKYGKYIREQFVYQAADNDRKQNI